MDEWQADTAAEEDENDEDIFGPESDLDPNFWIQNDPGSGSRMILDPRFWILDPGCSIHAPVSWILDRGSWIQDHPDPGPRISDPGPWIQAPVSMNALDILNSMRLVYI